VRRLADSGRLDDGTGFARSAGLGGQIALAAALGEPRLAPVAEAVLCALALGWLAWSLWPARWAAMTAPLALLTLPLGGPALEPRWSLVVLITGVASTLARGAMRTNPRLGAAAALLIGALIAIRHGALGVGIALIPALLAIARTARARLVTLTIPLAVVGPYLVALAGAGRGEAIAWWSPVPGSLACAAVGALFALGVATASGAGPRAPGPAAARTTLLAIAAGIAGAGLLSPTPAAAWLLVTGIGLAGLAVAASAVLGELADGDDDAAARRALPAIAIVAALVVARFPAARLAATPARAAAALDSARAALATRVAPPTALRADYMAAQAAIPRGARLGIRVERADLVDHRAHRVVDLAGCRRCDPIRLARDLDLDAVLIAAPPDEPAATPLRVVTLR
jgi:hypothetical protein